MAVQDLWRLRSGEWSARRGRGKRWRVVVSGHPSRAFDVKADAIEWERHLWQRGAPGGPAVTVAELVDLWLEGKRHLSRGGYQQCADAAHRVRQRWGPVSVDDVQRADVQAWVSGLTVVSPRGEVRAASHTIRSKALQCLSGALRIALEHGALQANPADGVRVGRAERRPARFLDVGELRRLADASDWPAAIWLLGTTGPRISEALALTVGSVDRRRRRIRIERSKSGTGRDIPAPKMVLDMLDLERAAGESLLAHPRGLVMNRRTFRSSVLLPAAKRAGLDGVTTHDLRHTAASLMIASGADVKMVQQVLGHASAAMTLDLYGHLFPSGLDDVAARLESMLIRTDSVPGAV